MRAMLFCFDQCVLGIVYASITTVQQVDLKKIIAYSSVGHMGVVTIGLFSSVSQSIIGSISLKGAAIDDLTFKEYNISLDSNEKNLTLS